MTDTQVPVVRVRDLMTTKLVTVRPHTDLAAADAVMQLKRLRHLPVVEGDRLKGLVTHSNLLQAQVSSTMGLTPREVAKFEQRIRAEDVMGKDIQTVHPDLSISEAGKIMLDSKFGCLPVIEDEKLVGIITGADLLKFLLNILERI